MDKVRWEQIKAMGVVARTVFVKANPMRNLKHKTGLSPRQWRKFRKAVRRKP